MIDFENKTEEDIDVTIFEEIYNELTNRDMELIIVNNNEIQEINKIYRKKDMPTDVLSFPIDGELPMPIGTVIISIDLAKEIALEESHSLDNELKILFLHGVLHLLGFDHEVDNGLMNEKEMEYRIKFLLPSSLISRNS